MNTGAYFDCEVYLKAWQVGMRGSDVAQHIDGCPWCGPLVNGHPDEFPLSIEEEARQRIEQRAQEALEAKRRNRRPARTGGSAAARGASGCGRWCRPPPQSPPPCGQ